MSVFVWAAESAKSNAWALAPLLGLTGVGTTLWINGRRAASDRRREQRARALAAVTAYCEMPFRIRRRRGEAEHSSGERSRLSDAFSGIQAELALAEALMQSDSSAAVRRSFSEFVEQARLHAGNESKRAWTLPPITTDSAMGLPDVYAALAPVRDAQRKCVEAMSK